MFIEISSLGGVDGDTHGYGHSSIDGNVKTRVCECNSITRQTSQADRMTGTAKRRVEQPVQFRPQTHSFGSGGGMDTQPCKRKIMSPASRRETKSVARDLIATTGQGPRSNAGSSPALISNLATPSGYKTISRRSFAKTVCRKARRMHRAVAIHFSGSADVAGVVQELTPIGLGIGLMPDARFNYLLASQPAQILSNLHTDRLEIRPSYRLGAGIVF